MFLDMDRDLDLVTPCNAAPRGRPAQVCGHRPRRRRLPPRLGGRAHHGQRRRLHAQVRSCLLSYFYVECKRQIFETSFTGCSISSRTLVRLTLIYEVQPSTGSRILLRQTGFLQKRLSRWARLWSIPISPNLSQPNPSPRADGTHCTIHVDA